MAAFQYAFDSDVYKSPGLWVGGRPRAPVDSCGATDVQQAALVEVHEDQTHPWILEQIADGVEEVVTRIVRNDQLLLALYLDEARRAPTMRSVEAVVTCFGVIVMARPHKHRVGAFNPVNVVACQLAEALERAGASAWVRDSVRC